MNILVANDDGINAEGIVNLVCSLSQVADVYVSAPKTQQSAKGHGITMRGSMLISKANVPNAIEAISVLGTPADCVKLGIEHFGSKGIIFDMVFSGINEGPNLGTDTLYSGTVSAAIEGSLNGIRSVAVSITSHHPVHFDYTCELAKRVVKSAGMNLDTKTVLNVNIPNIPYEDVKGVKYTRLGKRDYNGWYNPVENPDGDLEVAYSGYPIDHGVDDVNVDLGAIELGYATITPLKYDLTNHYLIDEIAKWDI